MTEREFTTRGGFSVTEHVDLESCHTDPVHKTALIQPFGSFLEVFPESLEVRSASSNIELHLGRSVQNVIGTTLDSLLQMKEIEEINQFIEKQGPTKNYIFGDGPRGSLLMKLYPVNENMGVDLEHAHATSTPFENTIIHSNRFLDQFHPQGQQERLMDEAVKAIKDVSDFDRVMMYQFDEDGDGAVIAEEKEEEMNSFENHHFPASDIPEPARRVYRKNRLRYIPDADYTPISIVGREGERNMRELDLTYSSWRSVPEVHREYLKNMNVAASCSISIMAQGDLWGLIACHGRNPIFMSWPQRNVCKLIGQSVSQQIERRIETSREQTYHNIDELRENLHESSSSRTTYVDLFKELEQHQEALLSFLNASAFYLRVGEHDHWFSNGDDPLFATSLLNEIQSNLQSGEKLAIQSIVAEFDENWDHAEKVSGFLARRIGSGNRSFCVWFRPEYRQTIQWGGNPREPFEVTEEGELSPRNSFEKWEQTVRESCRRWTDLDHLRARELVKLFNEMFIRIQSSLLEDKNKQLEKRNKELRTIKTELEEANEEKELLIEQIRKMARTDDLTELFNREEFMRQLELEMERAKRYSHTFTIAMLDLDHFKEVNDTYGHQTGDDVLRKVSEIMRSKTRRSDVCGRYGGEEFSIVFPQSDLEAATTSSKRILQTLRDHTFEAGDESFSVTCSIGLTEYNDEDTDQSNLIERADKALYRAKEAGRDRIETLEANAIKQNS